MPVSLFFAAATVDSGGYVSIWKSCVLLLALLIWARLLTWIDKDSDAAHMPRVALNVGFISGLILALLLFFMLPGFAAAMGVFVLILVIEISVYLFLRNQKVGLRDLKEQFKNWLASFGKKSDGSVAAVAGEVQLIGKGNAVLEPPEGEGENVAAEVAGYEALQTILTDPLRRRAERIEVVAGDQRSVNKFYVDGVPYEAAPVTKANASMAIMLLKGATGLDVADRRKPQTGTIKANLDGQKHELKISTAGTTAGESLSIDIDIKNRYTIGLDDLGFSNDQLAVIRDSIADNTGIVLLAAPKGQGLTTLEYGILRAHDAFLTHIQTVERAPEIELEGITQNELPANASASDEAKQINWVVSQEPEVILASRVEDPRSAADLVRFASTGKRAYVGLRAGTTFEALTQWRKLVGDDKLAMKHLSLIVAGRVVRRLCEACKMDYTPDPDTLRKLNVSPDRVGRLYTARSHPLKDGRGHDMMCEFCLDMKFKGRVGIYEIFTIDDEVRAIVQQGGSPNQLKMVFKKQKRRYLQEQALATAVSGLTSLQEVARVMKATGGESSSGGGTTSSGGARPSSGGGRPPSSPGTRPPSTSTKRPAPPAPRG